MWDGICGMDIMWDTIVGCSVRYSMMDFLLERDLFACSVQCPVLFVKFFQISFFKVFLFSSFFIFSFFSLFLSFLLTFPFFVTFSLLFHAFPYFFLRCVFPTFSLLFLGFSLLFSWLSLGFPLLFSCFFSFFAVCGMTVCQVLLPVACLAVFCRPVL